MCGRYMLTRKPDWRRFEIDLSGVDFEPRYNIAPSQPIIAVRASESCGERELAIFSWGLVPFWAREPSIGYKMLNARSETAAEKPAFRGPLRHHRCLIPTGGFFEWKGAQGRKQPYSFRRPMHEPFCFAGIFDHWGAADGSEIESASILTVAANEWMAPIHDRMPVIIRADDYDRWLDPAQQRPGEFSDLLRPPPEDFLVRGPVSPRVNSVKNDVPECIEAASEFSENPRQLGLGF